MKKLIVTLAFSFSSVACAGTPIFTTLSVTKDDVFAGVKVVKEGNEPETHLFQASTGDIVNKISLPKELIHREIISIYPANEKEILILTQRTVEQGDDPILHSFQVKEGKWKKLGSVKCLSFTKVAYEKNAVKLTCLRTNEKGNEVEEEKKISLSGIAVSGPAVLNLPIEKAQQGTLKAELIGDTFEWKEVKVTRGKTEVKFKALP